MSVTKQATKLLCGPIFGKLECKSYSMGGHDNSMTPLVNMHLYQSYEKMSMNESSRDDTESSVDDETLMLSCSSQYILHITAMVDDMILGSSSHVTNDENFPSSLPSWYESTSIKRKKAEAVIGRYLIRRASDVDFLTGNEFFRLRFVNKKTKVAFCRYKDYNHDDMKGNDGQSSKAPLFILQQIVDEENQPDDPEDTLQQYMNEFKKGDFSVIIPDALNYGVFLSCFDQIISNALTKENSRTASISSLENNNIFSDENRTNIRVLVHRVSNNSYIVKDSNLFSNGEGVSHKGQLTSRKKKKNMETIKKRKHSLLNQSCEKRSHHKKVPMKERIDGELNSFYFVTPQDRSNLSDYMFLIIGQVTRGSLTEKDLTLANRKRNSDLQIGYLGMRCRHCGGRERGQYFPSTSKNLQSCPSMIYKHLLSCESCPIQVKDALKVTRSRHKTQVCIKAPGTQVSFFAILWERIHDHNYSGGDTENSSVVYNMLDNLIYGDSNNSLKMISSQEIKLIPRHAAWTTGSDITSNHSSDTNATTDEFWAMQLTRKTDSEYGIDLVMEIIEQVRSTNKSIRSSSGNSKTDSFLHSQNNYEGKCWRSNEESHESDWDEDALHFLKHLVNIDEDMQECINLLLID